MPTDHYHFRHTHVRGCPRTKRDPKCAWMPAFAGMTEALVRARGRLPRAFAGAGCLRDDEAVGGDARRLMGTKAPYLMRNTSVERVFGHVGAAVPLVAQAPPFLRQRRALTGPGMPTDHNHFRHTRVRGCPRTKRDPRCAWMPAFAGMTEALVRAPGRLSQAFAGAGCSRNDEAVGGDAQRLMGTKAPYLVRNASVERVFGHVGAAVPLVAQAPPFLRQRRAPTGPGMLPAFQWWWP